MALRAWKNRVEEAKNRDDYWVAKAKIAFAIDLQRLMGEHEISNSTLANRLGVSAPYISKLLRGDANLTIESMVKAVRAVGGQINIRVSDSGCKVRWAEVYEQAASNDKVVAEWRGAIGRRESYAMSAANEHEAQSFAA